LHVSNTPVTQRIFSPDAFEGDPTMSGFCFEAVLPLGEKSHWNATMSPPTADNLLGTIDVQDSRVILDRPWRQYPPNNLESIRVGDVVSFVTHSFKDYPKEGNLKEVTTVFFVARTTWNSERDVYAYVEDPEKANEVLSQLTQDPSNKIEFEYRIEHDPQWEIVDYYLKLPKS
jgi:hypothetical protein